MTHVASIGFLFDVLHYKYLYMQEMCVKPSHQILEKLLQEIWQKVQSAQGEQFTPGSCGDGGSEPH